MSFDYFTLVMREVFYKRFIETVLVGFLSVTQPPRDGQDMKKPYYDFVACRLLFWTTT
jgi:hypothetical protein